MPDPDAPPTPAPEDAPELVAAGREMGFFDHLEELRQTLLKCFVAFVAAAALVGCALPWMADFLRWPLRAAFGREAAAPPVDAATGLPTLPPGAGAAPYLITTDAFGIFWVILQLVILGALGLALPFWLFFVAEFVAPALTKKEARYLVPGLAAAFVLFLVGAGFCFFVLLPAALQASVGLNSLLGFPMLWTAEKYFDMVVWMTIGVGLCFEFPLALLVLIQMGLLSTARLRAWRNLAIVVFLVVAAFVTPTSDPVTFLLLAGPLYALYELSILVGAFLERLRARREAAGE